jgi:translocation and assembly module TamB
MTGSTLRPRALKLALALLALVGLALLVILAVLLGFWLYLQTASGRAWFAHQASVFASGKLSGQVIVRHVSDIGMQGVRGADLELDTGTGRRVLDVRGVDLGLDFGRLLGSLLRGREPNIVVTHAVVSDSDILLEQAEPGGSQLLSVALRPKAPSPASAGPRAFRLAFDHVLVRHARVHGRVANAPIDVDVDGLHAAVYVPPDQTRIVVDTSHLQVHRLLDVHRASLRAGGKLAIFEAASRPLQASVDMAGDLETIPLGIQGALTGRVLHARVRAGPAAPAAVRELLGGVTLREPVSVDLRADGDLQGAVVVQGRAEAQAATLDWRGSVALKPMPRVDVALTARGIDPNLISTSAPSARIDGTGRLHAFWGADRALGGDASLHVRAFRIGNWQIPPFDVTGRFAERHGWAKVTVREPGFAADANVLLQAPPGRDYVASFDLKSRFEQLTDVPDVATSVSAGGQVFLSGRYAFGSHRISGRVSGEFRRACLDGLSAQRLAFRGRAQGAVAAPTVSFRVDGRAVRVHGFRFNGLRLRADGHRGALRVSAEATGAGETPNVRASALVELPESRLRKLVVLLSRDGAHQSLEAERVEYGPEGVAIARLLARGAVDAVAADLKLGDQRVRIDARARADLEQLHALFAWDRRFGDRGVLSARLDVAGTWAGLAGQVRAQARAVSLLGLPQPVDANLDLGLQERHVQGAMLVRVGTEAILRLATSGLDVGPQGYSEKGMLGAIGRLRLVGTGRLELLRTWLPAASPVGEPAGQLYVDALVERPDAEARPRFSVWLRAERASLPGVGRGPLGPLRSVDLDLLLQGGLAQQYVVLEADDEGEALGTLTARMGIPLTDLVAGGARPVSLLTGAPLVAKVRIRRRDIGPLAAAVRAGGWSGSAAIDASLRGTLDQPEAQAHILLTDLAASGPEMDPDSDQLRADRLRVRVDARYARGAGRLAITAERGRATVLRAESTIETSLVAFFQGATPQWRARATLQTTDFPLSTLRAWLGYRLQGELSGQLSIEDLGYDARARAVLGISSARVGDVDLGELTLTAFAADATAGAEATVRTPDGVAHVTAEALVPWGPRIVPVFELNERARAHLQTKNFDLRAVYPFVRSSLSQLEGRLDADLSVERASGRTTFTGHAMVDDGVVQIPALGQQFTHVSARVRLSEDRAVLEELTASGLQGRLRASGRARLSGLTPVMAAVAVRIDEKERLPLTIQGVPYGEVWGSLNASAVSSPGEPTEITVDLPSLHVQQPPMPRSGTQSLTPAPDVVLGTTVDRRFVRVNYDGRKRRHGGREGARMRIVIHLGDDVELRREGQLKAQIRGELTVLPASEPRVEGALVIQHGEVEVAGKQFTIDHGTVTFEGRDPANPIVVATARWQAADGTEVFADFRGTVQSGKLSLHSSPRLSDDEIVSLLLFGSPTGSYGTDLSQQTAEAGGAAVGAMFLAQGLNSSLSRLVNLDVTARVSTSRSAPRPELAVQLTRSLTGTLGYQLTAPTLGQPPDRTTLTFDYRLLSHWSLETTLGDQGMTLLDLVWRLRY